MIASLVHDETRPRPLETIDVWAVRAIHDALGAAGAARQVSHMVGINAYGRLPGVTEKSGIGTGECMFFPEHGHSGFSTRIDGAGEWVMIRDTLSALESASPRIPEEALATIVERLVRKPTDKGLVLGFVLTNTARPIDGMVALLESGQRP